VRRSVMGRMQDEADADNRARLAMLDKVISDHILIPPKFALYPQVEEVLWRTVQSAIVGHVEVDAALSYMRRQIQQIVRTGNGTSTGSNGHKQTVLPSASTQELRY
jgi:multiple sugar transport system substrate-binding protein